MGVFERGQFAFASSIVAIGVQFANLGFHSINTLHISKEPEILPKIIANNKVIVFLGTFLFLVIFAISYFTYFSEKQDALTTIILALISVPFGLLSLFNQNIFIALGKIKEFNLSEVIQKFSFIIFAVPIAFTFNNAESVMACSFFSIFLTFVYTKFTLQKKSQQKEKYDLSYIKSSAAYAFRFYIVCLLMFLILKIDIWMIESMLGTHSTGIYSVASSLTDALLIVPAIVGQLIFPRFIKNQNNNKEREYLQAIGSIFLFLIPICIFVFIFSEQIINLIFGHDFVESALSLKWLTLAVSFLGANTISMNYIASKEIPNFMMAVLVFCCLLNITLNFIFLKSIGIHGAAISSVVSYCALFVFNSLYIYYYINQKKGLNT